MSVIFVVSYPSNYLDTGAELCYTEIDIGGLLQKLAVCSSFSTPLVLDDDIVEHPSSSTFFFSYIRFHITGFLCEVVTFVVVVSPLPPLPPRSPLMRLIEERFFIVTSVFNLDV